MSGATVCVLVADDHPNIRRLLRVVLEGAGYRVVEAADGNEALALAGSERPDVAVLDHDMPGMTGLEVAAALASDPDTAHVRVAITSIAARPDDLGAAARRGVHAYVPKPFSVADLTACVNRLASSPGE